MYVIHPEDEELAIFAIFAAKSAFEKDERACQVSSLHVLSKDVTDYPSKVEIDNETALV